MDDCRSMYKRYTDAKGNWATWRSIYDEAYAFAIPERDPWPEDVEEGRRKNIQVYDITAVNSTRRLVSKLHSSLTPPGQQWFVLEAGDNIENQVDRKQLNMYLQTFTDIIFQALNESNFDIAINELYQDLCIGTGSLMIMESDDKRQPMKFKSVAVNVIYPEADAYDEIETVWRDFNQIYIRDIKRLWPKAVVPQELEQRLEADINAKVDLVEGVVYDCDKGDFRIVVMEQERGDYIMDLRSVSSPWVVARWSKCSNEIGGRGPIIEALPTIRSLNVLVEEIMRNVALSTSPPWLAASDGVFNPYLFNIEPNKVIPISRQSMGELPLQRLDVSSDVNLDNFEVNDMRMQIKDALFDNPIRPVNAPEQTATEVMIRQQQFMEEIGPAFGRLSVELLPKIINRVIFILQKKGYLPTDLKVDNKNIQIRYQSPLTRSASLQKIQNLQNYVAIMQPIMGPELTVASMNLELLPQWLSDKLDVDETLIKNAIEIKELIEGAKEAANQNPADNQQPANQPLARQVQNQQAMGTANG